MLQNNKDPNHCQAWILTHVSSEPPGCWVCHDSLLGGKWDQSAWNASHAVQTSNSLVLNWKLLSSKTSLTSEYNYNCWFFYVFWGGYHVLSIHQQMSSNNMSVAFLKWEIPSSLLGWFHLWGNSFHRNHLQKTEDGCQCEPSGCRMITEINFEGGF